MGEALPAKVQEVAERVLAGLRDDLLELEEGFGVEYDLFRAGLDSMSIMQVILLVEEKFSVKIPDGMVKRELFVSARRIAEMVVNLQEES